jgi:hypothetical protein
LARSLRNFPGALALIAVMMSDPIVAHSEEEAAAVLNAVAQAAVGVADSLSPIGVADVQSKADEDITAMNDQTQIGLAQIASDSAKFNAQMLADISLFQAQTAANINYTNNLFSTLNTAMLTSAQLQASRMTLENTREQRLMDYSIAQQKIAQEAREAQAQVELAKVQAQASLLAAGMSSAGPTRNSASNLSVRSVLFPDAGKGAVPTVGAPSTGVGSVALASAGLVGRGGRVQGLMRQARLGAGPLNVTEARRNNLLAVPGVNTFSSQVPRGSTALLRNRIATPQLAQRGPVQPPPGAIPHSPSMRAFAASGFGGIVGGGGHGGHGGF